MDLICIVEVDWWGFRLDPGPLAGRGVKVWRRREGRKEAEQNRGSRSRGHESPEMTVDELTTQGRIQSPD